MTGADPREWLELGYVARAHGVRGELRVVLHDGGEWPTQGVEQVRIGDQALELLGWRATKDAVLLEVAGVSDRDAAAAMRGRALAVRRSDIQLCDGEVLLADLIGCVAELEDGSRWGTVCGVERGPQDRLLVAGDGRKWELPLVDEFVLEIDLEHRRLVVAPPVGLPEFEES